MLPASWPLPARTYYLPYRFSSHTAQVCLHEWGDPQNDRILFCVHGLLQTGIVFAALAEHLISHYRVIAIDMPGHGDSMDLPRAVPRTYLIYRDLLKQVIHQLAFSCIDYVGVSMGGMLGYLLMDDLVASALVRRAVIVDIGPMVIGTVVEYIKKGTSFFRPRASYADAIHAMMSVPTVPYMKQPLVQAYQQYCWEQIFSESPLCQGQRLSRPKISPRVMDLLKGSALFLNDEEPGCYGSWVAYERIRTPFLVIRGGLSDVLPDFIADSMQKRLPDYYHEYCIPDADHVPLLCTPDELDQVANFLYQI